LCVHFAISDYYVNPQLVVDADAHKWFYLLQVFNGTRIDLVEHDSQALFINKLSFERDGTLLLVACPRFRVAHKDAGIGAGDTKQPPVANGFQCMVYHSLCGPLGVDIDYIETVGQHLVQLVDVVLRNDNVYIFVIEIVFVSYYFFNAFHRMYVIHWNFVEFEISFD